MPHHQHPAPAAGEPSRSQKIRDAAADLRAWADSLCSPWEASAAEPGCECPRCSAAALQADVRLLCDAVEEPRLLDRRPLTMHEWRKACMLLLAIARSGDVEPSLRALIEDCLLRHPVGP